MNKPNCSALPCASACGPPVQASKIAPVNFVVRRVEELFAFADSIELKTNTALERVNNLTQSILAKAFRGELTADYRLHPCSLPYGPTFGRSKWLPAILWREANPDLITGKNSAEALLEKIKAEREELIPLKKTKARKPENETK